ncbi:MAG: hypothetical protein MUC88_02315, partial [Planctomycetes bacterium]|nr:hypothetical protein [Planctomycetota bacterium]
MPLPPQFLTLAGLVTHTLPLLLATVCGFSLRAGAMTLYVSPAGNDAWSGRSAQPNAGRTDGPVATLERARDILRQSRGGGELREPARVVVADGTYTLTTPFVLTPQDSGTERSSVVYEAAPGTRPVFTGGRTITGFAPTPDGAWKVRVPEVAAGQWYFEQLFVNGRRAVRARTPNKFYHYMLNVEEEVLEQGRGQRALRARQTVTVGPEDLMPLRQLSDPELHDVQMVIYHKWDNTTRFIEAIDGSSSTIITTGEGRKSWNSWGKGD